MDRNVQAGLYPLSADASLSARRAWIEIASGTLSDTSDVTVALRKESVDRNTTTTTICTALKKSLSARRAWIEIMALDQYLNEQEGRSPQGERG